MAPKIFLAHAREDKAQVRKLYADLKARGFDPWLDEVDLLPGQIWKTEIPKAIRQAGVFLACLSSQSVGKAGYVHNEFRLALSAFGQRPPGSIFLIPVRLDDCEVPDLEIPDRGLSLRDIHWVDLWQEGGVDRLVRSIEKAVEVPDQAPRGLAEAAALRLGVGPDQAAAYISDQKVSEGPPKTPPVKPAPEREPKGWASRLWRNPTVVAAIVGAIGVVVAALVPWLGQGTREPPPATNVAQDIMADVAHNIEERIRAFICGDDPNCSNPNTLRFDVIKACWPAASIPSDTLMIDFLFQDQFAEERRTVGACLGWDEKRPRDEATSGPVPTTTITEEPFRDCDDCPLMVALPAGSFLMGSTEAERQWAVDQGAKWQWVETEKPQHRVQIAEPFAVSRYEVTFDEWDACVKGGGCNDYKPSDQAWGRGRRPVVNISWKDAHAYVIWLSKETGQPYRLLSEAEWEYAARAGTTTRYSWGDDPPTPEQANFGRNVGKTTEVGSYPPNPWGLRDVHGNVWEWVEDCWNENYTGAPSDGSAWMSGDCSRRVLRGGSWNNSPWVLRSADRPGDNSVNRVNFDLGFRVARTLR